MANSRFRPAIISIQGKKIAEIANSTYTHDANDQNQIGIEGVLGQSDGADETKLEFDTVTSVKGHEALLKQIIAQKLTVTFSVQVDGGYDKFEGRIISRGYTSDSKTGECKGKFSCIGGAPTLV